MKTQYITKKIQWFLLCVAVSGIFGCTTTEGVQPVGKDTYMLSTTTYGGVKSWSTVKADALKQANAYCDAHGQQMELAKDIDTSGARGWTPMNTDLTFKCTAK